MRLAELPRGSSCVFLHFCKERQIEKSPPGLEKSLDRAEGLQGFAEPGLRLPPDAGPEGDAP